MGLTLHHASVVGLSWDAMGLLCVMAAMGLPWLHSAVLAFCDTTMVVSRAVMGLPLDCHGVAMGLSWDYHGTAMTSWHCH